LIQKLLVKSNCSNEFQEIKKGSQANIDARFKVIEFVFRGRHFKFSTNTNLTLLAN